MEAHRGLWGCLCSPELPEVTLPPLVKYLCWPKYNRNGKVVYSFARYTKLPVFHGIEEPSVCDIEGLEVFRRVYWPDAFSHKLDELLDIRSNAIASLRPTAGSLHSFATHCQVPEPGQGSQHRLSESRRCALEAGAPLSLQTLPQKR